MTCRRVRSHNRKEQDYWLSFLYDNTNITEEERLDFLRYDSHGGDISETNPILIGKKHHGMYGHIKNGKRDGEMIRWYFDEVGWIGGLYMIQEYLTRKPFGIRPLREWFGDETVHRWLSAFLFHAFGWYNK